MDEDIDRIRRLRHAIRGHRDTTRHELCWHHPDLWGPLPEKTEAARGLPLGLADKLFLSLSDAEEFNKESRLFGRTDRSGTGVYHFRPFGRPQIEAYFGGRLAAELEAGGDDAFVDFAVSELVGLLGSDFARRRLSMVIRSGNSGFFNSCASRRASSRHAATRSA